MVPGGICAEGRPIVATTSTKTVDWTLEQRLVWTEDLIATANSNITEFAENAGDSISGIDDLRTLVAWTVSFEGQLDNLAAAIKEMRKEALEGWVEHDDIDEQARRISNAAMFKAEGDRMLESIEVAS